MFLAVHATAGAILGGVTANPVLSFSLGWLSHFLLDMIPHGDQYLYEQYKRGQEKRKAIVHVGLDALATVGVVAVTLAGADFYSEVGAIAGIVGGLLPDFLVGIFELFKPNPQGWTGRQLVRFNDLHMRNHVFLIRRIFGGDLSSKFGFVLQVLVLGLVLKWML